MNNTKLIQKGVNSRALELVSCFPSTSGILRVISVQHSVVTNTDPLCSINLLFCRHLNIHIRTKKERFLIKMNTMYWNNITTTVLKHDPYVREIVKDVRQQSYDSDMVIVSLSIVLCKYKFRNLTVDFQIY